MPYVRISLMKPLAGKEAEVEKLNQDLVAMYSQAEGCLLAHFVRSVDGSGEMGRLALWDSEGAADRAATSNRSMSLRSRLHILVRKGHQDRSFRAE
ncbi:MAG TPA: antibiotic biosynthesis monooxygenase [Dehalococcoidia bacterium]|nr:antibiotic biosynthesis monooxygenase [Dehalococcoidia bacterium]